MWGLWGFAGAPGRVNGKYVQGSSSSMLKVQSPTWKMQPGSLTPSNRHSALQALLRLSTASGGEGEDAAIARLAPWQGCL